MSTKKKMIIAIIGVEAVIIAAVIVFLFYINSDTVKVNRQLELAQKYLLEEDYEQAIAVFEGIIEIDPKNEEAYLGMAEAYAKIDDLENAVKILEEASKRVDSEEVLAMLETHTAEIEQRQQAAQRAAEAASQAAADAAASSEQTAVEASPQDMTVETQTPETEMVLTGFIVQDGELYYYDETGNYVTGWFDKNDNRYCARDDGRLYKDGEHEIDSTKYLFDQGGVCLGEVEEDAWKQAYIDYIKQKHKEFCSQYQSTYNNQVYDRYGLIDIDNDDIPELVVAPLLEAQFSHAYIISYSNGEIYGDSDCLVQSYIERGNLFYAWKDIDDIEATVQIWRIQDGRQTVIAEGYQNDEEYYYEWNGVQLADDEEFEEEVRKVYNGEKELWDDVQYTYKEILDRISNY